MIKNITNKTTYYAHGKLLLTAEYLVLDGATALAIPTKLGQRLEVSSIPSGHASSQEEYIGILPKIYWQSLDLEGMCWYESVLEVTPSSISSLKEVPEATKKITATLIAILETAKQLNPEFLRMAHDQYVTTRLEFDRFWGLGTSSTLIAMIAEWAVVDPFVLLEQSFGGSGYDIACAIHDMPILYTRTDAIPLIKEIPFDPIFKEKLFFVYRNQKQDSKASIAHYRSLKSSDLAKAKKEINEITGAIQHCSAIDDFEKLIAAHEAIISTSIQTPTVKSTLFPDFPGAIKSLGGWGGDFMLATGVKEARHYFENKGYTTIIPYQDMVL